MAIIVHQCACGCTDLQHGPGPDVDDPRRTGSCMGDAGRSCRRGCDEMGPPEIRPTWDQRGRPVDRIVQPGDLPGTPGSNATRTCGCEDCRDLYEQTTGTVLD